MAEIKWCSELDVQKRFKSIRTAANHDTSDVENAIEEAVNSIKPVVLNRYGADKVAEWTDEKTVPLALREIVANYAAGVIFQNAYGKHIDDVGCYRLAQDRLAEIKSGKADILDTSTGSKVADQENLVSESTDGRTPTFTMTHPEDDDFGDGSMDDL